jgi:hypothetical protein
VPRKISIASAASFFVRVAFACLISYAGYHNGNLQFIPLPPLFDEGRPEFQAVVDL